MPQRLLWASTGTKNPDYPDTLYLDTLIGKDTVNTVPPKTPRRLPRPWHRRPDADRRMSTARAHVLAEAASGSAWI